MINLIFLTVISWSNPALPTDSLRTEVINGKMFIIHQVGERETLYGISRRYGTPIMAILEFNATAGSGLEIGQILKIPYTPKSKVQTTQGTLHKVAAKETLYSVARLYGVSVDDLKTWNNLKDNALSTGQELIIRKKTVAAIEPVETQTAKAPAGFHKVEPKETLFFISRKYGVTIQQLKDWNRLPGDDVKVGSLLIVSATPGTTNPITNTASTASTNPANPTNPYTTTSTTNPTNPNPTNPTNPSPSYPSETIRISETVHGSDEVKEGGLAELIEGTEGNRKYLGLHRTAKPGTILKVRNELNNREVFVRIVGPLPPTGVNDNIVIKISKSAFDRLGAIDPKFRVEVTYYK